MDEKEDKSIKIVKSIKVLESVLRTSPNPSQRARVRKDINKLRDMLGEMYPDANLEELVEAIHNESLTAQQVQDQGFSEFEFLKDVEVENISPYRDDVEINEAASIMKYVQDRIWGVMSDQHTKLDFSNSGERDSLYRMLDQCSRSFILFSQTIEDIQKAKTSEHINQLQLMRVKQGRVFLFALYEFLKKARKFVSNLVSDAEFGGTMILNPDEKVVYANYENYKTFENWEVIESLKYVKNFFDEALEVVKMPDVDKF
jgi:hypothetical protein